MLIPLVTWDEFVRDIFQGSEPINPSKKLFRRTFELE